MDRLLNEKPNEPVYIASTQNATWSARLFYLIMLTRAASDSIFDALKTESGDAIGIGAIANTIVILVAALYVLRRPSMIANEVAPVWAPFIIVSAISVTIAPSLTNSIRLCLVQLSYCAVFAVPFYLVRTQRAIRPHLFIILWSSIIPVCWGILQLIFPSTRFDGDESRINSTFSHPNIFAFYLVLVMSTALYIQKAAGEPLRPRLRCYLWIYMLVLSVLLVCTKTRSAWIGALLVFVIYGLFFERRYLLYALLAPTILMLDSSVRERLADLSSNNDSPIDGNVNSYTWRTILWTAGINWMDSAHKLFGYGLDSFKTYSPKFFPLEGRNTWDPHNVYVQLFFETGIAGVISYCWLFLGLLKKLAKNFRRDRQGSTIIIASVLCYLVTSWTDNMLYYLSFDWYFWFLIGTVCAGYRRIHERA